jgi:hypothetical protein
VVLRHNPLCDREAKSGTTLGAAAGFVDAVKALENFALLFFVDPDSRILNRQHSFVHILFQR